jgi:hypothetical protein
MRAEIAQQKKVLPPESGSIGEVSREMGVCELTIRCLAVEAVFNADKSQNSPGWSSVHQRKSNGTSN